MKRIATIILTGALMMTVLTGCDTEANRVSYNVSQLKDLIADRNSLIYPDGDNEVYEQDIQALQMAIAALEDSKGDNNES